MIRVSELTKRFGSHLAVDRLSFAVARGEVVGFLGPNGAGKTTTIRVLTGFHPATSGTAEVAGHDVATASLEVRRQIGYLPQEVPIYPDLRVVEYLRYRAALKGVPAKERTRAVERAMQRAGIDGGVAKKLVGHVSHGYRQRVGLADALVANPPILVLDEPTSGMDPNQRRRIKQLVRDLAQEHTVLFSSHILGEVQEVCSRVLVIHRGVLRADGVFADLVAAAARTLRLTIAASAADGAAVIDGMRDLAVTATEPLTDGATRFVCRLVGAADPAPELGARLLAARLAVREMRIDLPTLEEYFHDITEGQDLAEESAVSAAAEAKR